MCGHVAKNGAQQRKINSKNVLPTPLARSLALKHSKYPALRTEFSIAAPFPTPLQCTSPHYYRHTGPLIAGVSFLSSVK